jgi:hypothetical protein
LFSFQLLLYVFHNPLSSSFIKSSVLLHWSLIIGL